MTQPKLSICCFTYNHARYLTRALESVLAQVVDFRYEIIIGDDCSNDGSQEILKQYANKYPDLIQLIIQPKNSLGVKNFRDVYNVASGEYVIVLETDDYWIDNNKLKKQVDFLNAHPECFAVAHNCIIIDENDNTLNMSYPQIKSGWYTYYSFMKNLMPGQTTSMMYRNIYKLQNFNKTLLESNVYGPGDLRKVFSILAYGKIYTLSSYMSAYRYVTSGGTSFSSNHKRDSRAALKYYYEFVKYAEMFNNKWMKLSANVRLLQTALSAYKRKDINTRELLYYFKSCKYPAITLYYTLSELITIKK